MTSRSANETTPEEVQAHEAAHWKPAKGFEWKKISRTENWCKEEDEPCWCDEPWCDGHEDGDHSPVWAEVRVAAAGSKRKASGAGGSAGSPVLGKRKASGGSAASPIDCDCDASTSEEADETHEADASESSEEDSEEEMP